MGSFLLDYYMWIKSLHVIAVMSWMAGMLYLPRLYVYHVEQGQNSPVADVFKVMERRLLRYIINPAMVATWVFGLAMVMANTDFFHQGWFHAKLTLVLLLLGVHGMLAKYRRQLEAGTCTKSAKFFRMLNEVPTFIMVVAVILVIVKPF